MWRKIHQTGTSGQALVALLFFMIIAMIISATAVALIVSNMTTITSTEQAHYALVIAEGGADNAIVQLLRNPNYSGEALNLDNGQVTITVTGATTKTVQSQGAVSDVERTIQVEATFTNGVMTITSWQEI